MKRLLLILMIVYFVLLHLLLQKESEFFPTEANMTVQKKKIAVTFDDGPHHEYTLQLLDGLKERNVRATFFLLGENIEVNRKIVERMAKEGHLIGNHTFSHIQLKKGKEKEFEDEIRKTNKILYEITGNYPEFVRPPYGSWNQDMEEKLNMIPVFWTLDPTDWNDLDATTIAEKVLKEIKENDIILMHDCYQSSVDATFLFIDELLKEGYEFVTADEILLD